MKKKIIRNLFLSVDYQREKSFSGIILNKHKIYLIGTLPVVFVWANGEKEISKIKTKLEIQIGDPQLKNILGTKADDVRVANKYKTEIDAMVASFEKHLNNAIERKSFANKPLASISIVNFK